MTENEGDLPASPGQVDIVQEPIADIVETTDEQSEIKELNFSINTLDTGKAEYITDMINGTFECAILEASVPVQVYITLADYPNIVLFDSYDTPIFNAVYLPLRVQAISKLYQGFTQTSEKYVLNDKIKCYVEGPMNATVHVILRYC